VLAAIDDPLAAADREQIEREMLTVFGYYFKEPAYALASVQTVMWMIKCKMRDIDIPEPLFTVLYGKQRGGKSSFWCLVMAVIRDLRKTVDVAALVSDSMLDLYMYFVIDTDEMAKADRACLAKLKNTVTTQKNQPPPLLHPDHDRRFDAGDVDRQQQRAGEDADPRADRDEQVQPA
jgi:hypothetical protein